MISARSSRMSYLDVVDAGRSRGLKRAFDGAFNAVDARVRRACPDAEGDNDRADRGPAAAAMPSPSPGGVSRRSGDVAGKVVRAESTVWPFHGRPISHLYA